jgi:alpha-1,3-rhamnosyltransferase
MAMSDRPLVSVIMPAYNHEAYVERAIRSVVGQTYRNIELIVVDDGSTDRTWDVIRRVRAATGEAFQIYSRSNHGVAATLNFGIQRSAGAFVAPLASDDAFVPEKTEWQLALFAASGPQVGLVHGSSYIDFGQGRIVASHGQFRPAVGACLRDLITQDAGVVSTTCMFRRAAYNRAGGFDESMVAEDVDFYVGLAACGYHFAYDPTPLVKKTVVPGSLGSRIDLSFDVHHRTLRKHADRFTPEEYRELSNAIFAHLGRVAAGAGRLGLSLRAYSALAKERRSLHPYLQFGAVAARRAVLSVLPAWIRHRLRQARARTTA